mmetsp:Transcript_4531/g.12637  ORF Transcript_4531/g.12637 Transcript_4531/m.12637 type:complete len:491 (+) Transcript_4531:140-1612(+)
MATGLLLQALLAACVVCLWAAVGHCQEDPGGWLDAHNDRRRHFHAKYGKSYKKLLWSESLARGAQEFADYLVDRDCKFEHCSTIFGSSKCKFGENLAKNWGSGGARDAEEVLTAWTEEEEDDLGGHYTQVLWRATKYLGCGVASAGCGHIQVCRYLKPGNCNGRDKYLDNNTPCGPDCPEEGCFTEDDLRDEEDSEEDESEEDESEEEESEEHEEEQEQRMEISEYGVAQIFRGGQEFDLSHTSLHFARDSYDFCRQSNVAAFPVDPSGGEQLKLQDDGWKKITFDISFPFFGRTYQKAYVASNGFITFEDDDNDHSPSLSDHFKVPRISGLFVDLTPNTGGEVSWKEVGSDAVVVTFLDVPTYKESSKTSSFQIAMYASGDVTLTWLDVLTDKRKLVGLSKGDLPPAMSSVDLSAVASSSCDGFENTMSAAGMMCPEDQEMKMTVDRKRVVAACYNSDGKKKGDSMKCEGSIDLKTVGTRILAVCDEDR